MTLKKVIKKYKEIQKAGYETITIAQVLGDLWHVKSIGKESQTKKLDKSKEED